MPLISIRIVPSPTGTGSASEPPCRTRSSSSVRSAARAGAADVVGPRLQLVELLDDGERDDDVVVAEGVDARRIGDQHRRVEDDSSPGVSRGVGPGAACGTIRGAECGAGRPADQVPRIATRLVGLVEIGHRHSSSASISIPIGIVVRGTPTGCCCTPRPPVGGGWWATGVGWYDSRRSIMAS